MAEYIDREYVLYVIAHFGGMLTWGKEETLSEITQKIKNEPAADIKEVVHGRWILEREPDGKPYCFHCSVCDDDFHHIGIMTAYDYCPNCGAKMDGEAR